MGEPPTEPLAQAVNAMLVGLHHLGDSAIDETPGALMIRAAAVMIAEASACAGDGQQRAFAETVINEVHALAGRRIAGDDPLRHDVKLRLQVAVNALVGVAPYA